MREQHLDLLADFGRAHSDHARASAAPYLIGDWEKNRADDSFELSVAAGTALAWPDVELHAGAQLLYRAGPSKLDEAGVVGELDVSIELLDGDGAANRLLDLHVAAGERAALSGVVELASLVGKRGELRLTTRAADGRAPRLAWTQLELRSQGRAPRPDDRRLAVDGVVLHLAEKVDAATGAADVLTVAVPGSIAIRVQVPDQARLCCFDALPPGQAGAVKFGVRVDGELLREWRRQPTAADAPERRREVALDLARFGGREVELSFEAQPAAAAPVDPAASPRAAQFVMPRLVAPRLTARQPRGRGRPDVFVVVVDTLRADALSCYGAPRPTSPRIDAFAREALLFERAYAPSPWTLPSTTSLLTGLAPDVHGVTRTPWLPDRQETLAERFAALGITTGGFVANSLISRDSNFQQGFETWQELSWGNARKVVARALEWVDRHEDDRLFAYLHLIDPHAPYSSLLPPGERTVSAPDNPFRDLESDALLARFAGTPLHLQVEHGLTPELRAAAARARDLYDDEVRWVDRWFGALLDGLRARGRLDDAVIVLTADHGEEFLDHRGIFHGDHLYDESVRVPLIVRAPTLAAGRAAAPWCTMDLGALLDELLTRDGAPQPLAADHFPESIVLATEHATELDALPFGRREGLVRGRYKLIASPRLERLELYDLVADPAEQRDLSESEPRVRDALAQLLRERCAEHARQAGSSAASLLPDLDAELRRLGYVK